jgi:CotH kinase protein
VLEFTLSNNFNIPTLDNCNERPEVPGTLKGWDGAFSYSSGNITLKCRGNSSAYWHPKKGYSLELKKDFYFGIAGNFLGMPADTEWVLHSCWADKTCLRNVIGYWLAGELFPWAPRTEFAEVYINGYYRGLYVVTEKIEIAPDRVNLPQPNNDTFTGGINGAYILQEQGNDSDFDWRTFYSRQPWWLVSPNKKQISPAQQRYIKDFMDIYVDAKFSRGSTAYEPWEYDEVMDEQSAVDFVIIQEIANNPDGYWKSLHVTKYPLEHNGHIDDLVHMGPIWDLDLAFGNYAELQNTQSLNYDDLPPAEKSKVNAVCETDRWRIEKSVPKFGPLWEMWSVPQFRRAIYNRWWSLRSDATISRRRIVGNADHTGAIVKFDHTGVIDKFVARIADARARDDSVWHTLGKRTFVECWNETTYEADVNHLKSWIYERITWMDQKVMNVFW